MYAVTLTTTFTQNSKKYDEGSLKKATQAVRLALALTKDPHPPATSLVSKLAAKLRRTGKLIVKSEMGYFIATITKT